MRVLVVGGGGFFGRLVVEALGVDGRYQIVAAGRRPPAPPLPCPFAALDLKAVDLSRRVAELAPDLVVHCAGPFVPGDHALVEAALACGSHYLDLAENRRFVGGIAAYHRHARARGVTVQSGVSSVPALSSAVVAAHRGEFSSLRAIDIALSASERLPGLGAVRAVLAQSGEHVRVPIDGQASGPAFADRWRIRLPPPVGARVVARCDVPDLDLFPQTIPGLRRVSFRAGVASPWLMLGLRVFARMRRRGWIRHPESWAAFMALAARVQYPFGNGASGMLVRLSGEAEGTPRVLAWQLVARDHQGVQVPARGVVAMAGRLAEGRVPAGAGPCFMTLTPLEYLGPDAPVSIRLVTLEGEAAREDEALWQAA